MSSSPPMTPRMEYNPPPRTSSGSAVFDYDPNNPLYWGHVFPEGDEESFTITGTEFSYQDSGFGISPATTAYSDQSSNIGSDQDLVIPDALYDPLHAEAHNAEPGDLSTLGGSLPVNPSRYPSKDFDYDVSNIDIDIDIQNASNAPASDNVSSLPPTGSGSSSFLQVPAASIRAVPRKRQRKNENLESTNLMRILKSCSSCKLKKVRCNGPGTCLKCEEECAKIHSPYAQQQCIRDPLSSIIKPSRRWVSIEVEHRYNMGTAHHAQSSGGECILSVSLSPNPNSDPFTMIGREFISRGPGIMYNQTIRVNSDLNPTRRDQDPTRGNEDLLNWIKGDIRAENGSSFRGCLERLLLSYSDRFEGLPWGDARLKAKQVHTIMVNVLNMACTEKIWATGGTRPFFHNNGQFTPQLMPVQAHLCLRAAEATSTFEWTALEAIQDLVDSQTIQKKEEPTLQSALFVGLWSSLWLLMLVYHDALTSLRRMAPANMTLAPYDREAFEADRERLLHSIVVVYSVLLRNRTTLVKCVQNASHEVFGNDGDIYNSFQEAWQSHFDFYRQLDNHSNNGQPSDDRHLFFKLHVVDREAKLLNARRSRV